MTWIVKLQDLAHTRAINDNTVELTLLVRQDTTGTAQTWNPWTSPKTIQTAADIPVPGDRLGDYDTAGWASELGTFASWADQFRVRTVSWRLVKDSMSAYLCTIRATNRTTYCPEPTVRRSDSAGVRSVDRYRDATPTTSTVDEDTIAGTAYTEIGGKPQRFLVSTIDLQIVLPWRTDDAAYTDGYPDLKTLIGDKLQKVNSATFLGFEPNSLMLTGVDVDPKEDEYLEVTVSFRYDSWYHFNQEPDREVNGDAILEKVGSIWRAKTVRWRDMSRGTYDFNNMFSTDEKAYAQYGWQAWDTVCLGAFMASYDQTEKKPLTALRSEAVP